MNWNDMTLISSECCLLIFACLALLYDVFSKKDNPNGTLWIALTGVVISFLINIKLGGPLFSAFLTTEPGAVPQLAQIGFYNMVVIDPLAILSKCFTCILTAGVFLYARTYIGTRSMPHGEYYVMALFALIGMQVMISAYHFMSLYLGLELLSLPLYAMVAMRREQPVTSEAAIKYFVMGALASGLLLYGISLIYGMTGGLDYTTVKQAIASSDGQTHTLLVFGLVFMIAGMAFKLGAVPFHMWLPDVYQGAPAAVTLLIATAPKVAALVMMLRLLLTAVPGLMLDWQPLLIILSIASMALGNFVAMLQTSLKRLLAYSTIAHVGYLFLGLISGTQTGFSASVFYILIYSLMTLGTFGVITVLSQRQGEFEWIDDLRGLNSRNPWLAFVLLILMFSLAGIPPTVGFFAKLSVIQSLIAAGKVWLAVIALLFAVVGAYYYIRIIRVMYFEEPQITTPISVPADTMTLLSINGVMLLLLGLSPGLLLQLCQIAIDALT